jgi:chromosome segregation ATPase
LIKDKEEANKQIRLVTDKLNAESNSNSKLISKLSQMEQQNGQLISEISNLRKRYNNLNDQLLTSKTDLERHVTESNNLKNRISTLENENKELKGNYQQQKQPTQQQQQKQPTQKQPNQQQQNSKGIKK